MDSSVINSPSPPRPTANAEAENVALATQTFKTGTDEKSGVAEAIERDGKVSTKEKKVHQAAGMKNYFVSVPLVHDSSLTLLASLLVRNQVRLVAYVSVLYHFDSLWCYVSSNERRLWYDLPLLEFGISFKDTDCN